MSRIVSFLRAPRTAFAILASLGLWSGIGAWAPWARSASPAPAWAAAVGLDRPFTAWPFLALVALLFSSTLACTWGRRRRLLALRRGELPPGALSFAGDAPELRAFLVANGFRGEGPVLRRHEVALWGGWILHVGLLLLIAAVFAQQAFADSGVFDLTAGEAARLDAPGTTFGRERGPLASARLPEVEVRLEEFDPFLHQAGYASDRLARLTLLVSGEPPRVAELDRAAGVAFGGIEVFQAIPTGLSLVLDVPGMGRRAVRLAEESRHRAAAAVTDPGGNAARFVVDTERELDDPLGTGRVLVWLERDGRLASIVPGTPFPFGDRAARAVGVGRWGRFTWSRTAGLPSVWIGFAVILAGCALLAFPAGVARLDAERRSASVFAARGAEVLAAEWGQASAPGRSAGG